MLGWAIASHTHTLCLQCLDKADVDLEVGLVHDDREGQASFARLPGSVKADDGHTKIGRQGRVAP